MGRGDAKMKLYKMTSKELNDYRQYCIQAGNIAAIAEINDFEEYYGNIIEIIGGRIISKGIKGTVFYAERFNYSYRWWNGKTRIGFRTEEGQVFFTDKNNLQLMR